ncbi:competence/damage-inducible protein A [Oceanibium sediminis]|uniref:competence/damage-inducible protein A n=1 Tax=Oceanibium sediminis TaxID=2026339 RepID=UPI000DD3715E|nr:molybdopterin-binding protein [Oceanibium sediminis]
MANPTAAMLVIGDEILSGRTRDANMYTLAGRLSAMGVDLREVRVVSDDRAAIVVAVNALRAAHDHVFTSGGIGPTHDDITADCIAEAFGVPIDVREDARQALIQNYPEGEAALTPARLRMARIPEGASLIDNPVSRAPGFTMENVHVMAGVPSVFNAMVESVLPTITGGAPLMSESVRIDRGESDVAEALGAIQARFPQVAIGSYPFQRDGRYGTNIVLRSADRAALDGATNEVRELTV